MVFFSYLLEQHAFHLCLVPTMSHDKLNTYSALPQNLIFKFSLCHY